MDQTARFALPFLVPGQMQKELLHNEALQTIDMLLCPVVEGAPSVSPPPDPPVGRCYVVGTGATGAWASKDGSVACYTEGGWRFVAPSDGLTLVDRGSGQFLRRQSGTWELGILRAQEVRVEGVAVVRNRQPAIGDPDAGAVIDSQCRATVGQILAAMRAHGLIG